MDEQTHLAQLRDTPLWFTQPMRRAWAVLNYYLYLGEPDELDNGSARFTVADQDELMPACVAVLDPYGALSYVASG